MLKRSAAVLVAFAALFLSLRGTAFADNPPVGCTTPTPQTGSCPILATPPPPDDGDSGTTQPVNNPSKPQCVYLTSNGNEIVPCSSKYGVWSNPHACYLKLADPQPPKNDPVWNGHTNGGVYTCTGPDGAGNGVLLPVWLAQGPAVVVDPEALARQALRIMNLRAINIGITPEPGANKMGYVGLPTYLWVRNPAGNTFGPITRSASAGGVTVTATAKVKRVVWNMGDGSRVVCTGAGTAYQDSYGSRPSPTCGHSYTRASAGQPGNAYQVTATSYWSIDWAGMGQNGTITMDLVATTQIRVGEIQVLVQ